MNESKDAILMPRQKVSNLINAIEQGKVSDEEFRHTQTARGEARPRGDTDYAG